MSQVDGDDNTDFPFQPRRPLKQDGTPDLRYGARPSRFIPPRPLPFTTVERAIAEQHVADLETVGVVCRFVADFEGRPEALVIRRRDGEGHVIYRAGGRVFCDEVNDAGAVMRDERGWSSVEVPLGHIRIISGLHRPVTYAGVQGAVVRALASLPDWLV